MEAYEGAGGRVERARKRVPLDQLVETCYPDNWIELRYLHCDGSPVVGARYVIEADGYSAGGVLDDEGFTHIEGVPSSVSRIRFRFEDDPEPYVPRAPDASTASPESQAGLLDTFEDILDWLWGTVQGDFNQEAKISQIAVNTIIGLIPIADQVLDVRDLIAGMKHLISFYMEDEDEQKKYAASLGLSYETWLWIGLFLIAIGLIPTVGSAVKGVLKSLIRALQDAGDVAGRLSAAQLRRIWEQIIAALNFVGISQGNAHRWLRELPPQLNGYMDTAAKHIRDAADVLGDLLDDAAAAIGKLKGIWGIDQDWVTRSLASIARAKQALATLVSRLERQKEIINTWLGDQLKRVIGERELQQGIGTVNTHPTGAAAGDSPPSTGRNQVVQEARPAREPDLPAGRTPTAERIEALRNQGHGPQRHEGQVTQAQLEDRVLNGTDPMTGSNINPHTGQPYNPPRRATRITSEEAYVQAEQRMRSGAEFEAAPAEIDQLGNVRKQVTVPLEDAIGSDYEKHVEGVTRVGSANPNTPTSTRPTNLKDGEMVAVYQQNDQGGWDLLTMYPNPTND